MNKKALFLIDGVHKPDNSVFSIKELCSRYGVKVSALLWIGGTEKIKSRHDFSAIIKKEFKREVFYFEDEKGKPFPEKGIREIIRQDSSIKTVVQLSGAPQIFRKKTNRYASVAVSMGAQYLAGGTVFSEYRINTKHKKPSVGLYATNKRVGKTSFGSYIGNLMCGIKMCGIKRIDTKFKPIIITHSRGGPPDPPLIEVYKSSADKPAYELTKGELLTSRFKPEYLSRLLDFGLHGASDVFEDALRVSAYLDRWEESHNKVPPYISMIGCRRAGAGYFNEFVVSNAGKGIKKANESEADIIIHEGSGAEHPPVEVDGIIFFIPSDVDLELLDDFPGLEKSILFIIANCQKETAGPDRVKKINDILKKRSPDTKIVLTRFVPEVVAENPDLKDKEVAFFTTAPNYILKKLALYIEKTYGCRVKESCNNLDNDIAMKKSIDRIEEDGGVDFYLFEIKARGVEGAGYIRKKYKGRYFYINNIPLAVDEDFKDKKDNRSLDIAIIEAITKIT
ncbi:MAG: hypothetical protein PF545_07320 [Elusimicrobia bacterium]|nr:hypothetical protein [Elusimicrobiota bacterium]